MHRQGKRSMRTKDAANILGISLSNYNAVVSGQRTMSPRVCRLMHAYNIMTPEQRKIYLEGCEVIG